jgi:hypothetical protein
MVELNRKRIMELGRWSRMLLVMATMVMKILPVL